MKAQEAKKKIYILAETKEKAKPKLERPEIIENIETDKGFGIDFIDDTY